MAPGFEGSGFRVQVKRKSVRGSGFRNTEEGARPWVGGGEGRVEMQKLKWKWKVDSE